jgi:excisionase family DNA binding protein
MVTNETKAVVYQVYDLPGLLGISLATAYEYISKGEIPHIKVGARILIPKKMFDDWLAGKKAIV